MTSKCKSCGGEKSIDKGGLCSLCKLDLYKKDFYISEIEKWKVYDKLIPSLEKKCKVIRDIIKILEKQIELCNQGIETFTLLIDRKVGLVENLKFQMKEYEMELVLLKEKMNKYKEELSLRESDLAEARLENQKIMSVMGHGTDSHFSFGGQIENKIYKA